VSINLFRQQLADERIVTQLDDAFARWPLDRSSIPVELAEAPLATHIEPAVKTSQRLRGGDVLTVVDDFGTGVSGLGVLRDLDIDTVKIDGSLIESIAHLSRPRHLVRGMLALCQELGCRVFAEGVETREQRITLGELKCEYGQGLLLAEPMSGSRLAEQFALWQSSIPTIPRPGDPGAVH
jgi:EAL domain-containing protein (putative c-di-GMP-specific phosphodiesterase class I)